MDNSTEKAGEHEPSPEHDAITKDSDDAEFQVSEDMSEANCQIWEQE